jgi:hypothetical protein
MAKKFTNILFTHIVRDLREEGISITRKQFYRLIARYEWPVPPKGANGWRVFGMTHPRTPEQRARVSAPYYKALIRRHYGIDDQIPARPEGLIDYQVAVATGQFGKNES